MLQRDNTLCILQHSHTLQEIQIQFDTRTEFTCELEQQNLQALTCADGQYAAQVMQYADRALMEGLKGRCAMLLHPHVTQDSALPLLQQALAMDSDRSPSQLAPSTVSRSSCVHTGNLNCPPSIQHY